ncbi:MAG: 6-phosphogluconolactonase [Rhizobiaceae bacterium]|nr:6-phosphogluconolactonase [Rhizobiaceae bacterium]
MPVEAFNKFESRDQLAEALSDRIAELLDLDFASGAFASIALSGGSTPKGVLDRLGPKLGANMEMIYFALVDERNVSPEDDRSNEKMIRNHLGLQQHPASEFLSLYAENQDASGAAELAHGKLLADEELPFDVVTLGMGTDGHTASFFPGGDNLNAATDPDTEKLFLPMLAPGAKEPRITMALPPIASAKSLFLHIEGDEKLAIFEEALKDGPADDMPIRHVLRHPDVNLQVYWAG